MRIEIMKYLSLLKKSIRFLAITSILLSTASHATLISKTYDSGSLTGAQNVVVDGQLWDVEFIIGSFIDVFADASGLDVTDIGESVLFSQALLDQVFTGVDDSMLTTTYGCDTAVNKCRFFTPYDLSVTGKVFFSFVNNSDNESLDATSSNSTLNTTIISGQRAWADWTLSTAPPVFVAAPGNLALMGISLLSLALIGRAKKSKNR